MPGDAGRGGDTRAAMSTCAGCGVALDSSGRQGGRECPNCKAGESVWEGSTAVIHTVI
jgi:hypothetical protein